jgi:hypothetical protein
MFGDDRNSDAAAAVEGTGDFHPSRTQRAHEVIQDSVDHSLMECAMVSEGKEIEFERFAFQAASPRTIFDLKVAKIGLPRDRTEAGEFGTVK